MGGGADAAEGEAGLVGRRGSGRAAKRLEAATVVDGGKWGRGGKGRQVSKGQHAAARAACLGQRKAQRWRELPAIISG